MNQYSRPFEGSRGHRHRIMARLLRQRDYEPVLVWGAEESVPSEQSDVELRTIKIPRSRGNGFRRVLSMGAFGLGVLRLARTPKNKRPEIVLASSPHLIGATAACLLARYWRVPFILEIRDLWPLSIQIMMGVGRGHPLIAVFSLLEKYLYRKSDGFVLLFAGAWEHIKSIAPTTAGVVVIPNGMENWPILSDLRAGAPSGAPLRITYAGAIGLANSMDTLVDAASVLKVRGLAQRVIFDLYGEGVEKERLQSLARERGLRNVVFHDPIPKSAVPAVLGKADVLVMCWRDTALYQYGVSPNKISDYMAAAKPILNCLNSPFDPVSAAGAGWTVRPEDPQALADQIEYILNLPPECLEAAGKRGFIFGRDNYDWAINIDRLTDFLHGYATGAPAIQS